MPRALVVQTSFLGDAVLTTPLLATLAARGPVTLVVTPASASLFEGHPHVADLVAYDKRGADAGVAGFTRLVRRVRTHERDAVAYLAQGSHRSGALARLAGYGERVGLATSSGRAWYTHRIEVPPGTHHVERLWRLAGEPATASAPRPRLFPLLAHEAAVDRLFAEHGVDGEPLVAVAPGSVWATKRWPHFPALARALAPQARVVVVGGPDDRALAGEVIAATGGSAIDATGRLPLLASAALLARCRALVTNDSAPLHLATAMNTPTIAVFGPTVPAFGFGPLAERAEVVEIGGLECRPCHAHGPARCPLSHFRCMRDLTPTQVLDAVHRVTR